MTFRLIRVNQPEGAHPDGTFEEKVTNAMKGLEREQVVSFTVHKDRGPTGPFVAMILVWGEPKPS
jgi:hypothetical protein